MRQPVNMPPHGAIRHAYGREDSLLHCYRPLHASDYTGPKSQEEGKGVNIYAFAPIFFMESSLPSKRDIQMRFAIMYGSYFSVILLVWLFVRIPVWYMLPLLAVLAYVGRRNYRMNVRILLSAPRMSSDDFSGYEGVALTDIEKTGQVRIRGEVWKARSDAFIPKHAKVRVEKVKGMVLTVARI